jgi:hypothetical protein
MYLDYREAWKVSTEEDPMPEYLNATAGLKQSAEKTNRRDAACRVSVCAAVIQCYRRRGKPCLYESLVPHNIR